ncbi:ubiquitin carboxyl-terminal hydrolase MINDY-1-like [Mercenaria mercenaria]|uniref:ubiquitin carboxyl-terminal hydrolase MINDY-1-like n=1 Tax=Mercenaria mercenaria TaxID=6596 RepID=UPI00234E5CAE|nr:ubiquitin carboxyl-terminal hydrolase MINDY-1-like [Mercenaria mercenaria]
MADNLLNNSSSQIVEENTNQNNSLSLETDKLENLPTPPTQKTTDSEPETNDRIDEGQVSPSGDGDITESAKDENNSSELTGEKEKDSDIQKEGEDTLEKEDAESQNETEQTISDNTECDTEETSENIALKVELPPKDSGIENEKEAKTDGEDTVTEGACSSDGGAASDGGPSSNTESIHQVKWVYFKKKQVPIITQNENGPCPLLALINVLLLQNRVTLPPQTEIVSAGQLMAHLGDCVLENVPGEDGVSTHSRLNFEQNMGDAMAVMYKLQTGLDVNVRFTGVRDFEYTSECIIFDLLQIALYHGWLVDPQNAAEVEALGKCSYNQLVEKIIVQKTSDQHDLVSQALVAEEFLENSASQLTYHGLCELCTQLKEDELAVLFRNNHFTTLYRHKDELFQLVTDQGFLQESNVVWETLSNVEGDCHFVDSEFRTYTKPEPPPLSKEPSNVPINSEEQIDHDYLVALSLQQEQQPPEQIDWTPQNSQLSDEELAKQLQEEERRAAMAEANEPQRRQGQPAPRPQGQQSSSQRRPTRGNGQPREEKKTDCCIL